MSHSVGERTAPKRPVTSGVDAILPFPERLGSSA